MKHHVSPSTALRLKEAGYPQPKNRYGHITTNGGDVVRVRVPDSIQTAYRPTATEIMEQPGMDANRLYFEDKKWVVADIVSELIGNICRFERRNPAEAAAEMYLKIKQQ